jgi:hypothetical protein
MIRASSLLFFLVVSPQAPWMSVAFAVAVVIAAATLWLNPADVDSALGSILLLQMFAASNGFAASASRGHFDPLLAGGRTRRQVAAGNLAASTLPGAAAWMTTALVSVALGGGGRAVAAHRCLAIVLVSAIAWAGGLALPKMAAGALWAFVLLSAALSRGVVTLCLSSVQSAPSGALDALASAATLAVCPFLLLGDFPAVRNAAVLAIDCSLALIVVWGGFRHLSRRDYTLVEPV